MKTIQQLETLSPCRDGLKWARQQPSLYEAWETCSRSDWMWWLLEELNKISGVLCFKYGRGCAYHCKHCYDFDPDDRIDGYTPSDDFASAAYVAGYNALYVSNDTDAERKWQADFLRTLVENPFEKP